MKKIIFTHSINSVVSKFTSLFLAIYFLKITDGNVASVVFYYIVKYSLNWVFSFLTLRYINKNNVLKMYRLGLFSNGICLLALLLLGANVSEHIVLYAILDCATSLMYWSPYKMILYNFKSDNQLKKVFSYNSIVSSIISIISTVGMGYIIVNFSYEVVLTIIITLIFVACFVTFKFDKYDFENISTIKISNMKYVLKDNQARNIFKIVFWEGMGYRGGLTTAITLIIFFTLGSESSLGNLDAIFALLGLITAFLVKKYLKEKDNKVVFKISALAILIATIPIIFTSSFEVFVIYNVIFNIAYKITQILVDTAVFNISSNKIITKYQLEYTFISEVTHGFGKAISEIILLVPVIWAFNLNNIRIVTAILSATIVIQMVVYNKFCKNKGEISC